jgi:oligopeptide/dipeptide ABC transporter ATP-binding protein
MVPIVRDVSLEVFSGETLALAGETGSGKSTLALALLGLIGRQMSIEAEAVLYEGTSITGMSEGRAKGICGKKIGIVFQDSRSALNPVLTVQEHLMETLRAHRKLSRKEARARALELLEEVGIPGDHAKLYPFELSGGISQRVGIALAICNSPGLLIADEPTSALDTTIQSQIIDMILALKRRRGLALLLISHDLALISQVADRVSAMYHGRIVESGPREDVLSAPAHPYTQCLIESQPGMRHHHEMHPLKSIPGSVPIPGQDLPGCSFAPRCALAEPKCREAVPPAVNVSTTHWAACIHDLSKLK